MKVIYMAKFNPLTLAVRQALGFYSQGFIQLSDGRCFHV